MVCGNAANHSSNAGGLRPVPEDGPDFSGPPARNSARVAAKPPSPVNGPGRASARPAVGPQTGAAGSLPRGGRPAADVALSVGGILRRAVRYGGQVARRCREYWECWEYWEYWEYWKNAGSPSPAGEKTGSFPVSGKRHAFRRGAARRMGGILPALTSACFPGREMV